MKKVDMAYELTKVCAQNPNARPEDMPRLFVNFFVMLNDVDSAFNDSSEEKWSKLREKYAKSIPKMSLPK